MSSRYGQIVKDIEVGYEEGEKPVQAFIRERFGVRTRNVGHRRPGWDLELSGVDEKFVKSRRTTTAKLKKKFTNKYGKTFEVKRDKVSDRTGNFFFEVWSNIRVHNPGCVAASKADVLVLVRKDEFLFIDRGYFLSWVIYNLYHETPMCKRWKKKTCGRLGDPEMKNSPISPYVRGILIPMEDIKKESCIEVFKRKK